MVFLYHNNVKSEIFFVKNIGNISVSFLKGLWS